MRNDTFYQKTNDDDLNDDEQKGKKGQKQKTKKNYAIKNKTHIEPTTWFIKSARQ